MTALPTADFEDPVASGVSKAKIDELAAQVAAKVGYKPGADLEPIVRRLGGVIQYHTWDVGDSSGSLEVRPGEKPLFTIRLPSFASNMRNRFTIAHELGHYFLHSDVGRKRIRVERAGTGRVEWEANWFAAGFLLPEAGFREDWAKFGGSVGLLIGRYKVSTGVIEIRQQTLGLA